MTKGKRRTLRVAPRALDSCNFLLHIHTHTHTHHTYTHSTRTPKTTNNINHTQTHPLNLRSPFAKHRVCGFTCTFFVFCLGNKCDEKFTTCNAFDDHDELTSLNIFLKSNIFVWFSYRLMISKNTSAVCKAVFGSCVLFPPRSPRFRFRRVQKRGYGNRDVTTQCILGHHRPRCSASSGLECAARCDTAERCSGVS